MGLAVTVWAKSHRILNDIIAIVRQWYYMVHF